MKKIIVLSGPTCSGKTDLSLKLAKKINGEIINADSMQVYKYLNIGTCKIQDKKKIKHHLLDIKNPDELYSIYDYQIDANIAINNIQNKGKVPIIVGGSGLYIQSLLTNYKLNKYDINSKKISDSLSNKQLYEIIKKKDNNLSKNIDYNNRRRLISLWNNIFSINDKYCLNKKHNYFPIALMPRRENLYDLINIRTEKILNIGFIEEVKFLLNNFNLNKIIKKSVGYKQIIQYLNDENLTYYSLLDDIKQATRRVAKKQITWIKNQKINYHYYTVDDIEKILEDVNIFLNK